MSNLSMEEGTVYLTVIQAVLCTLIRRGDIVISTAIGGGIGILLCFDCRHMQLWLLRDLPELRRCITHIGGWYRTQRDDGRWDENKVDEGGKRRSSEDGWVYERWGTEDWCSWIEESKVKNYLKLSWGKICDLCERSMYLLPRYVSNWRMKLL